MKYYTEILSTFIYCKITVTKIRCAKCVADVAMLMHTYHIISKHTAVRILLGAMNYAQRVVEKYCGNYH